MILSAAHHIMARQQMLLFFGGYFLQISAPKYSPGQACIINFLFFTLTHANVKSLASALIYYTAVVVILSLTALAGFSLFFPPAISLSYCKSSVFGGVLLVFTVRVQALVIKNHKLL